MEQNIVIPIITAIIGAITGAVPAYISFNSKKMELEYSYNKSKEERLFENSRQYLETLYKPIYKILNELEDENYDNELSNSDFRNSLSRAIVAIDTVRNGDNMIFLTKNVELEISQLLRFIKGSLNCTYYTFGIKTNYRLFGINTTSYSNETYNDEKLALKAVKRIKYNNILINLMNFIPLLAAHDKIFTVNYEIICKSADTTSGVFKKQLSEHINSIKSDLKQIAIGDKVK